MPQILIVEDEPIIANDIQQILRKKGYNVIGIAHDSETGLDMIHTRKPDLILLDVNIEGQRDGVQIAELVREKYKIPFIFLTSYSDESTLDRAKATNPLGYIVKPFDERTLLATIEVALHNFKAGNEISLDKCSVDKLCSSSLSDKEFVILEEVLKGLSSAKIAKNQFISINTVKFHLKNLYLKMQVSSKAELLAKVLVN